MPSETETLVSAAHEALDSGDWSTARASCEAALEQEQTAEALSGLGDTLGWLGETHDAVRCFERAYAIFYTRPDPAQASVAAISLYLLCRVSLGNVAASRGWLARAARLADEFDLGPMDGWVLLVRAHDCDDPVETEALARRAFETGRELGDSDLEPCALSQLGVSLVELGRIDAGLSLLDEAMAGSLGGEGHRRDTVVWTSCNMITSCSRAAEFERAAQWIRVSEDFTQRYGSPHLYTLCRLHLGNVLFSTGRWGEAETELEAAVQMARKGEPAIHGEALAKLAELRLAQGRLEEAERLSAGRENDPAATHVLAALQLARGEPGLASSMLRRRLRAFDEERLESAGLLELLSVADIDRGEAGAAASSAQRLAALAERFDCEAIAARAHRTSGRALLAAGSADAGVAHLERALDTFARLDMRLDAGRSQLLLATAMQAEDRQAAVAEARRAQACFEELGATRDADEAAAFLRACGVKAARSGRPGAGPLTKRECEILELLPEGLSNKVMAQRLFLSPKTVEHHVRSVLSKLGLRSRAEAAAYAVRHLDRESAAK